MHLNVVDYLVLGATLLLCALIGILSGRGQKKGTADYLLGNRQMSMVPVAFSIMATLFSAIAIAGGVGEMYLYGAQFQISALAGAITKIIIGYTMVPVFHNMEYTSIYEYLEHRFDRMTRLLFSGFYLATNVFYLGLVLYVPALAVTTISGIPYSITASVTGVVCTFYCVAGGFKAVIWTDVVQTILMFACVIMVIVKGSMDVGGFGKALETALEGDRLHLTLVETDTTRFSVWSLFAMGVIFALKDYGTNQAGIQRFLSVKSAKVAQSSILLSAVLMLCFKILLILLTIVIYAKFSKCDPLQDPDSGVKSLDQILIHAIEVTLSDSPGLTGVALSGILSGALSTFSSYINAFAAVTLVDFLQPYCPQLTSSESRNILICKVLTAAYGLIAIVFSFVVPHLGGAIKIFFAIVMGLSGPICGVMVLAIFVPRANAKATKIALLLGTALFLWIAIGAQMYPINHDKLPLSTSECNSTLSSTEYNVTTSKTSKFFDASEVFVLYRISFAWFSPIGTVTTILFGYLLSLVIAGPVETNPKLLSPIIRCPSQRIQEKL